MLPFPPPAGLVEEAWLKIVDACFEVRAWSWVQLKRSSGDLFRFRLRKSTVDYQGVATLVD